MENYCWKVVETPKWEPVSFAASCVDDNVLYMSGGWNPTTNTFTSQVWTCNFDFQWQNHSTKDGWSPRNGHSLTKFKDRLYLIGGFNYGSKYLQDIWVLNLDEEKEEWNCIQESPPWEGREGHQTLAFRDSLWIFGGITESGVKNDIWYSKDGVNWEEKFEIPPWSPRCFHNVLLYNNKIWLITGSSSDGAKNDMYFSKNGENWQLFDGTLPFTPRFGSGVAVIDDKIWLIGGSDAKESEFYKDIWWFTEKEGWNELYIDTPWNPRWGFNCLQVYKGNLILLCGGVRFPDRKYSAYADGWALVKK